MSETETNTTSDLREEKLSEFKEETKESQKYYIIYEHLGYRKGNPPTYIVHEFFPGEKNKKSCTDNETHGFMGNWFQVIPDTRSAKEILASNIVRGMICLEGGSGMFSVPGSSIYLDEKKAEYDAQLLTAGALKELESKICNRPKKVVYSHYFVLYKCAKYNKDPKDSKDKCIILRFEPGVFEEEPDAQSKPDYHYRKYAYSKFIRDNSPYEALINSKKVHGRVDILAGGTGAYTVNGEELYTSYDEAVKAGKEKGYDVDEITGTRDFKNIIE